MNALQTISILLELMVVALGITLVVGKKKMYGWCIALTFILYVFYDLANLLSLHISQDSLDILFFMATLSILWAIWNIFLETFGQGSVGGVEEFGIDPLLHRSECHWTDGHTGRGSFLKEGIRCQGDDLSSLHLSRSRR
ncbi:MAG TPA: hypothetical protein VF300_01490 [Methanothrix sp.]